MTDQKRTETLFCLTFDDGPSATTMGEVLDTLAKYRAKATFFIVGSHIDESEACHTVLQRAVREGHELANHSWSHPAMGEFSERERIMEEFSATQRRIAEVTGVTPLYFRPPYLSVSERLFQTVPLPFITMSTDTVDYEEVTPAFICDRIVDGVQKADGAIILQHCFEGNRKTVEALEAALLWCQENGYRSVTLSELFREKGIVPRPGKVYRSAEQIHQNGLYR